MRRFSSPTQWQSKETTQGVFLFHILRLAFLALCVCGGMALAGPPSNDNFANAIILTGSAGTVDGTTVDATIESGDPCGFSPGSGSGSVWYTWTPPLSGALLFSGSGFLTNYTIYTGTSLSSLASIEGGQFSCNVYVDVRAGQKLYIEMSSMSGYAGSFSIGWQISPPPVNDGFANAIALTGSSGNAQGTTVGETSAVWYSWTPPASGAFIFNLSGMYNTHLTVYSGTDPAALTRMGETDTAWGGQLQVNGTAGQPVRISVKAVFADAEDSFNFGWQTFTPPANDNLADATLISGSTGAISGNNTYASVDPGDSWYLDNSVWFAYTVPQTAIYQFALLPGSAPRDVFIYSGSSCTVSDLTNLTPLNFSSTQRVTGTTGEQLRIEVCSQTGDYTLSWLEIPLNDTPAGAVVIGGTTGSIQGSNLGATTLNDHGLLEPDATGATVWFQWTAPASGSYLFGTTGTMGTALGLFRGTNQANFVRLIEGSSNQPCGQLFVNSGDVVWIEVDGLNGATGPFSLNWQLLQPPTNDNFAAAKVLSGTSGNEQGTTLGATPQAGEPALGDGATVWFCWTAPATGIGVASVNSGSVALAVLTGNAVSSLTKLQTKVTGAETRFLCTAGQTYYFQVAGSGSDGSFSFSRNVLAKPGNDDRANALTLSGTGGTFSGTTMNATGESGEYAYAVGPYWGESFATTTFSVASVWYSFHASQAGVFAIGIVQNGTAAWDPLAAVFVNPGPMSESWCASPALGAQTGAQVSAGDIVKIAVEGNGSGSGDFKGTWGFYTPPPNISATTAQVISGSSGAIPGTTTAAMAPNSYSGIGTVWYAWSAPLSGPFVFSATGASISQVAVYSGSDAGHLTRIASGPDSTQVFLTNGEHYWIAVSGAGISANDFTLRWYLTETVGFEYPYVRVNELAGSATLNVTRVGDTSGSLSLVYDAWSYPFNYGHAYGWAWAGTDYTAVSGTVQFLPGQSCQSIVVPIFDNNAVTEPRNFLLDLNNPDNSMQLDQTNVTICDGDADSIFQFTSPTVRVKKSDDLVTVVVQQLGLGSAPASVEYQTADGTAVAGTDYTATSGTLNFTAGELSAGFQVPIRSQPGVTGDRDFSVRLTALGAAGTGAVDTASVTIVDTDNPKGVIEFGTVEYPAMNGAATGPVTVVRSGGKSGKVFAVVSIEPYCDANRTINSVGSLTPGAGVANPPYDGGGGGGIIVVAGVNAGSPGSNATAAVPGTELGGSTTASSLSTPVVTGTVFFTDGQSTATLSLPIPALSGSGGGKLWGLTLSDPSSGATVGVLDSALLDASAQTAAVLQFSADSFVSNPITHTASVTVSRSGNLATPATVEYFTVDSTAKAGRDYRRVAGTLRFRAGARKASFAVPVSEGMFASKGIRHTAPLVFSVILSGPTAGTVLGGRSQATVNIKQK